MVMKINTIMHIRLRNPQSGHRKEAADLENEN